MNREPPREVIFERRALGNTVRVAAIDVDSGMEVVVMGPVGARAGDLKQIALRKLKARLMPMRRRGVDQTASPTKPSGIFA